MNQFDMTSSPHSIQVDLKTNEGKQVKRVWILRYHPLPRVIMWGIRVFVLEDASDEFPEYHEAFAVAVTGNGGA